MVDGGEGAEKWGCGQRGLTEERGWQRSWQGEGPDGGERAESWGCSRKVGNVKCQFNPCTMYSNTSMIVNILVYVHTVSLSNFDISSLIERLGNGEKIINRKNSTILISTLCYLHCEWTKFCDNCTWVSRCTNLGNILPPPPTSWSIFRLGQTLSILTRKRWHFNSIC